MNMGIACAFQKAFDAVKRAASQPPASTEFTCGDCERVERCGLPPTDDCPIKLAQLQRDPTGHERRMARRAAILQSGYWI
jgi:hypothetical protein